MPEQAAWIKRYGEGLMIGLLAAAVWAGIAYLFHEGYSWGEPLFYGLVAASVMLIAYFGFTLVRRIPKQKIVPTPNNIENCVRTWLDNHKVMVKNDPHPDCYFRLRITMDGGCVMTILRSTLEYQDYVQIICDLGIRGDDKKLLNLFNDSERAHILLDIKTELARAKVGYSGLVDPPENFQINRRVPVYPNLNEFIFMAMVGDVEAARNLVFLMFLKARMEHPEATLPLASDTPKLEPPTA